jgi:hypothetical protein
LSSLSHAVFEYIASIKTLYITEKHPFFALAGDSPKVKLLFILEIAITPYIKKLNKNYIN